MMIGPDEYGLQKQNFLPLNFPIYFPHPNDRQFEMSYNPVMYHRLSRWLD